MFFFASMNYRPASVQVKLCAFAFYLEKHESVGVDV